MADKYGPIFMIKLGVKKAVVVSSHKMAKECLGVNDRVFMDRPQTLFMEIVTYNNAFFGLGRYSPYWRDLRKLTTVEFLSNHRVEMFKHVRISEISSAVKELYAKRSMEPVDMKLWFNKTFLTGTQSIAVTLIWALSLLLNNKEAMKKAQTEIDRIVGKERWVREPDIKDMTYLEAVLKETLRLYPPGPLSFPRESVEDCTVNNYHIPAGTQLFVNLYKIQRDPEVWPNPLEFRPERFLTTHKDYDVWGQNFAFTPFGSGRRICPGITFSMKFMMLTLATLLHGFEISTPLDEAVDTSANFGLTSLKTTPLDVILVPRLPENLYYPPLAVNDI